MSASLHGEEVQGAEAVLRQLKDPTTQDSPKTASDVLKARLEAYRKAAIAMPPDNAAAEWIQLLESYLSVGGSSGVLPDMSQRIQAGAVIEALPPVSSWDALAAELAKRSAGGNTRVAAIQNFVGALVAADPAGRLAALARLEETIAADETVEHYRRAQIAEQLDQLEALLSPPGSPTTDPVAKLSKQLDILTTERFSRYGRVEVPSLPDNEAAKEVIIRLLKADLPGQFENEEARQLVIRIAKEQLEHLPEPPWKLIISLGDAPLFQASAKLRPEAARTLAESEEVKSMLLRHYLLEGKEAEARAMIRNLKPGEESYINVMRGGNYHHYNPTDRLDENAEKLQLKLETEALQDNPNLSFWNSVGNAARQYGQSDKFQKSVEAALVDPRLTSPKTRHDLEDLHLTYLLSDGKVEEGMKLLEELLAKSESPSSDETTAPELTSTSSRREALLTRAIHLARLLERPELLDHSLEAYSALLPTTSHLTSDPIIWASYVARDRAAFAEKGLTDRMVRLAGAKSGRFGGTDLESPLQRLAWLYDQLGRYEDVIRLLDEAPFWNAPDLAELRYRSTTSGEILLIAAKAMKATGQNDKALEITHQLIRAQPGYDEGYLLHSQLNPPDQITFLQEIAAANRFQERPLIWQAKLLLTQGKTEEAEATVKKAIAIDPSDGEQGKGDRMRAYEVLADILEKKGDAEQMKFFRNVVAAIRLSETADDWWAAGMTQKAIEIYEQSLRSFADAYCIQSRLALRYASNDNMEKATPHYQRAFELMPDSFGRIESHCFGCEGAFNGEVAQSIAEKVFTGLAEKPDAKPQVFYLLGYLRQSQGRMAEAKEYFQKTVKMDPDYVNAWAKLRELSRTTDMTPAEKDEIAFSLFRLNSEPTLLSEVSDLRKVWAALLDLENNTPAPLKTLYPLPAAKERLAASENDRYATYYHSSNENPRSTISRNPLMSAVTNILESAVSSN
jgi:tetratricopeptide (TPR) repeat protein